MAKYLVTGGWGFIGSHLVDYLIEAGHKVRVLDLVQPSYTPKKEVESLQGSITQPEVWKRALEGVDGVFHLAAKVSVAESVHQWHTNHLVNSGGMVALLEKARDLPLIYASSAAVYGGCEKLPHREETPPQPLSPYAVDKLSNELQAQVAWHLHQTPSIGFRFFNVYGPRQNPESPYSGVISIFTHKIAQHQPITIYGDGGQTRDFVFVKDVAQIVGEAMGKVKGGAFVYNLCTGREISVNFLADLIGEITLTPPVIIRASERRADIRSSRGDPNKLIHTLGLKATTPLEEGLRALMQEPAR